MGVTGVDPDQPANALRAGERHSLAVARALHFGARVLVFDEPTTPMTVAQHALVLQSLVAARREGMAVLFVTNNPRYAHLVGDRFVLLAGGQVAGNLTRDDVDAADLTRLIAGGDELTAITAALSAAPTRSWASGGSSARAEAGAQPRQAGSQSFSRAMQRSCSSASPMVSARAGQQRDAAQEAAVRLVRPRHRAVALPAVAAQRVEAAVVAGAGVGVGLDGAGEPAVAVQGPLGERGPRGAGPRVLGGHLGRVAALGERGLGRRVAREQRGRRLAQQVDARHRGQPACDWPADSRSSQASCTRAAMPVSAALR